MLDAYGAPIANFTNSNRGRDLNLICGEFLDRTTYIENTGTRSNTDYNAGVYPINESGSLKMEMEKTIQDAVDWDKEVTNVDWDNDGEIYSQMNSFNVTLFENFSQNPDKVVISHKETLSD
ncbi:hypothetical protein [Algoriphagus yeomjeoni]|uniref:Uncharacterized protein n=1 Tax=Algoriphagus yeomjeoni TaxID=291403 RepID=A0A327NWY5_9BACT|nr:hypothetical protein [Algoriphagus yeomjeoni]RAI83851.1 hypothetical protein LV83_04164 [Algoriphagus yeomjeoni]